MWGAFLLLQWRRQGSFAGSLLAHGLLLAAIVWLSVPKPLPVPPSGAIIVDLIPETDVPSKRADQDVLLASESPQESAASAPVEQPEPQESSAAPRQADGMISATQFYAAAILDDPANSEVRENFPLLAGQEQIIQICNIEALEQLREAKPGEAPDALVGYAFDSVEVNGLDLVANGGAFRSNGQWYRIRYHCAVAADIRSVAAFDYALGELVPESEWEAHFLNGTDE